MRRFFGVRRINLVISIAIALAVWQALTLVYPPLVIPTIPAVAAKLAGILGGGETRAEIFLTLFRLLAGLAVGVAAGTAVGALLGGSRRLHDIFRPLIGVVQSVPPVSWLVLALIWFGFNGRASVFIVAVGVMPVMVANMVEGVRGVDAKLLEMARVYKFSRRKRLRHVIAPSMLPHFRAGLHTAIGIGGKTVVMGEVLTTANGIGGEITNARLNLEPESVVAWTIAIIVICYLLDRLAAVLLRGRRDCARHADHNQPAKAL